MKRQTKRLGIKSETIRSMVLPTVLGGAAFTETGTGLCVTNAQYSCVSVAAGCA